MASINYPFPDPKNEAEYAANRQATDDYQRQEQEGADFLDWGEELGLTLMDLDGLVDRVRFDLETAGFWVSPPAFLPDDAQGGLVVHVENGEVVVDWLSHARLNKAVLAMVEADRLDNEAVTRYEAVREAMSTALGAILHGFGYRTRPPLSGAGHTVLPPQGSPTQ